MKILHALVHPFSSIATKRSGSRNQIRTSMHGYIIPGQKVLFAGVGKGFEVLTAAELGAQVTVVDTSETLLGVFRKSLRGRYFSNPIRIVHRDILQMDEYEQHDLVFANFYLCFLKEPVHSLALKHLAGLVKPGGLLVVSDFSPLNGGFLSRLSQQLYLSLMKAFLFVECGSLLKEIQDHRVGIERCGLKVEEFSHRSSIFPGRLYSLAARKR